MKTSRGVALWSMLASVACTVIPETDDADAGPPIFKAEGNVSGAGGGGVLATIWTVSSDSPDYAYKFGKTSATGGTSFFVSFSAVPPDAALNSDGVGVGVVALFPLGTAISEGKIDNLPSPLGFTTQHAIIYKKPGSTSERWWIGQFEDGFSCGACAPPPAGQSFEGYKPTICSGLELVLSPQDSCSWT
jgi:hypothetical protein